MSVNKGKYKTEILLKVYLGFAIKYSSFVCSLK